MMYVFYPCWSLAKKVALLAGPSKPRLDSIVPLRLGVMWPILCQVRNTALKIRFIYQRWKSWKNKEWVRIFFDFKLWTAHPRRPRGSQSGREKRRDESFQTQAEGPLGTDCHRTISKRSSECWLLIGHKKYFVLLCPIGEQFLLSSFREFVHDGWHLTLTTLSRSGVGGIDGVKTELNDSNKRARSREVCQLLSSLVVDVKVLNYFKGHSDQQFFLLL